VGWGDLVLGQEPRGTCLPSPLLGRPLVLRPPLQEEGIVVKPLDSPYELGSRGHWLKVRPRPRGTANTPASHPS
jgi:hypothetical protein